MGIKERLGEHWMRNSLIHCFKPTPSELRQLDFLIFKMRLFQNRLLPDRPFLSIPRYEHWESVPAFQKQMLAPLLLAYLQWPIRAFRQDGQDNRQMHDLHKKDGEITYIGAIWRLMTAFNNYDDEGLSILRQIINRYDVELIDVPEINNAYDLSDAERSWVALLNEHTWKDLIPNHPKIAVLGKEHRPELLPRKIVIYDQKKRTKMVFDKLFGHFFVPDIYRDEKHAKALFDALSSTGLINEISDYDHKSNVTRILLKNIWKRIKQGETPIVLDPGCGNGFVGEVLEKLGLRSKVRLYGIDISAEMLNQLQKKRSYDQIMQMGITSSKLKRIKKYFGVKKFTDIVMAFVSSYLSDQENIKAFKNFYNLLIPGGSLSFDVHHPDPEWQYIYRKQLEVAGFKRIEMLEREVPTKDGKRKVGFVFAER